MIIKKIKTSQEVFRPNVWGNQKKKKKRKKLDSLKLHDCETVTHEF